MSNSPPTRGGERSEQALRRFSICLGRSGHRRHALAPGTDRQLEVADGKRSLALEAGHTRDRHLPPAAEAQDGQSRVRLADGELGGENLGVLDSVHGSPFHGLR